MKKILITVSILLLFISCSDNENAGTRETVLTSGDWVNAVSYSGYRDGQSPGVSYPGYDQIKEDLVLLQKYWKLIRIYDTTPHADTVLQVIKNENLDIKVMLGIWLEAEVSNPNCSWGGTYDSATLASNVLINRENVSRGIALAKQYPNIIAAINVGNEALVSWTDHLNTVDGVVAYVKQVKAAVSTPVTVCDNYVPWANGKLDTLAEAVDFISIHSYPQWESYPVSTALAATTNNYNSVKNRFSDKIVVISEAGWCSYATSGEPAATASEENQKTYYNQLTTWASNNKVLTFFFEFSDENWKGGSGSGEPEKHWGLFTADRYTKLVIRDMFPEITSNASTTTTDGPILGTAQVHITNRFNVYSENANGSRPNYITYNAWESSCTISAVDSTSPYEGTYSCKIQYTGTCSWGWGLGYECSVTNLFVPQNLSHFSNGYLIFNINTAYSGQFLVGFQSGVYDLGTSVDAFIDVPVGQYGYTNDGNWTQVVIPVTNITTAVPAVDLETVTSPFCFLDTSSPGSDLIYIDDIYWSKELP